MEGALVEGVGALVPGDFVIVGFGPDLRAMRCSDPAAVVRTRDLTMKDLSSHPAVSHRSRRAVTVSDSASWARWERTDCFQKCFRLLGQEDDLGINLVLGPGTPTSACVMRPWRKFAEEERVLLTLLATHLPAIWAEARAADAVRLAATRAMKGDVIVVDGRGRVKMWSAETRANVARAFGFTLQATRSLPVTMRDWLRGGAAAPLVRNGSGQRVEFWFIPDGTGGGVIALRHSKDPLPAGASVTRREREVLGWAVTGMHNEEIAGRMAISAGTVKRHLENAFHKLGVRNRTEAAAIFRTDAAAS